MPNKHIDKYPCLFNIRTTGLSAYTAKTTYKISEDEKPCKNSIDLTYIPILNLKKYHCNVQFLRYNVPLIERENDDMGRIGRPAGSERYL